MSSNLFVCVGRTETIRTCSVQAVAFVRGMENAKLSAVEKFDLLRKACDAHTKYTIMAMKGLGCDRHLLGLKMCLKPGEMHPLLSNKLLSQSTHFRLSTSSLSSGENYNGKEFINCVHFHNKLNSR
jgi:carnitine O-acetyltransferase